MPVVFKLSVVLLLCLEVKLNAKDGRRSGIQGRFSELFIALTEIAESELVSRIRGLLENGYPKFCIIRSFWFRMPIRGVSVVLKHPVLK